MSELIWVPLAGLAVVAVLAAVVFGLVSLIPADEKNPSLDKARENARQWGHPRDTEVEPLVIEPRAVADRISLGRLGKKQIAAPRFASVALFAPTQSGKTTAYMVPRIVEWEGAMVATSAKADLVRLTLEHRRQEGPVWVFDPLGFLAGVGIETCTWSPLARIRIYADAMVAANWITATSATAAENSSNQRFWDENAKMMLAPLLFAAAQTPHLDPATKEPSHERHISQVFRWLNEGADADPDVRAILARTGDVDAVSALKGVSSMHDQTRKNVAATAQVVLGPFAHPRTREALTVRSAGREFSPERLLDEGGTLFVFAPEHEASEFKTLFETIINTVVFAAQDRSAAAGGVPIGPHHLLMALDEAANMASLSKLPELASVGSSQGIVLLSVWQNVSQIEHIYGEARSRTLLAGHNIKMFWGGIHDSPTLKYVDSMCGDFEHKRETRSLDGSRRSRSITMDTQRLAPPDYVMKLPEHRVLALVRNGKPLRLQLTPWYIDDEIRAQLDPAVAAEFDAAFGGQPAPAPAQVHIHLGQDRR